jgi:hypothetical protein
VQEARAADALATANRLSEEVVKLGGQIRDNQAAALESLDSLREALDLAREFKIQRDTLAAEVILVVIQLRAWANASLRGGWSTHQVQPMRSLADRLEQLLTS